MIVVDTNVVVDASMARPRTASARAAFLKDPEWCAPPLWRSEFRNVLALYLRTDQLTIADALKLFAEAESLIENHELPPDSTRVLHLVNTSNCSAYDCEFVALAQELSTLLVTSDVKLMRAFPDTAVLLADFAGN